jgi:uncharacterized protein
MIFEQNEFYNKAKNSGISTLILFSKWKKKPPDNLDKIVLKLHYEVFKKIDCLKCANCCKKLGPKIIERDIVKLSRYLKMKPSVFFKMYLKADEEGDYIFKTIPCLFLNKENFCKIYDFRPKACIDYPHTARRKFHQILDLTLKNCYTCPAVYEIVEKLKRFKF